MNTHRTQWPLIHFGASSYEPNLVRPICDKQRYSKKPSGGLWTSPLDSSYGWRHWCRENDYSDCKTSFQLLFTGNLLVIDSAADLLQLTWVPLKGIPDAFVPCFEPLLPRYDAVHLTVQGQEATRFSIPYDFYGWDCESVLILNPRSVSIPP